MEVALGIHRVEGVRGANVYLIAGPPLTLIDTGLPGNARAILSYIRKIGWQPQDLKRIILTHYHLDHAGSAAELQALTGAGVLAHPLEAEIGPGGHPVLWARFTRRASWGLQLLSRFLPMNAIPLAGLVQDGEVLPGGLRILHTPGHTPGSLSLYLEARRALFCGDLILNNGERLSRPLPIFGFDVAEYERSLKRLAGLDVAIICFSHGAPLRQEANPWLREFACRPYTLSLWWRIIRNVPRLATFPFSLLRRR